MNIQRYQKAIAVLIVGALSFGANFLPALDGVSPEVINGAAFALALVLVFALPNKIAGMSVDTIASAILDIERKHNDARAAEGAPPPPPAPTPPAKTSAPARALRPVLRVVRGLRK